MTFAIMGHCRKSGMLGVAVTTSSISVGSRCPWVRAGVGAVSTQNCTLPSIGPQVLDKIGTGLGAGLALKAVMRRVEFAEFRQVIAIDANGSTAQFTGCKTLGTNAVATGQDCIAAGNLLQSENLPRVMVESFENSDQRPLPKRLVEALSNGLHDGGGEEGPVHSAALLVADKLSWPLVDLRVDWSDGNPIEEIIRLWNLYEPQTQDYVMRALDPTAAPSFGVPGDE